MDTAKQMMLSERLEQLAKGAFSPQLEQRTKGAFSTHPQRPSAEEGTGGAGPVLDSCSAHQALALTERG